MDARMVRASGTEIWGTPDAGAHLPSTIFSPGEILAARISSRRRCATFSFSSPRAAAAFWFRSECISLVLYHALRMQKPRQAESVATKSNSLFAGHSSHAKPDFRVDTPE